MRLCVARDFSGKDLGKQHVFWPRKSVLPEVIAGQSVKGEGNHVQNERSRSGGDALRCGLRQNAPIIELHGVIPAQQ
jgi:hypothetical protein